jgi:hypothetical protein
MDWMLCLGALAGFIHRTVTCLGHGTGTCHATGHVQWDMPPPDPPASGIAHYEACAFVDLPVVSYFDSMDRANPRVVTLPPINPALGHSQPLSNRERAWLTRPALRHAQLVHLANPSQLAERAQLREAVLVTQRGYRPPVDHGPTTNRYGQSALIDPSHLQAKKYTRAILTRPDDLLQELKDMDDDRGI